MVKTNGTVFVVGEELSRDTEAQLRYLWSALQFRGELSRFSEVRLRDGERLQENLRASASAVFVRRVPIDLINLARASDAAAIYWGTEVEKSDWQSFAQLRQIIAAADVLVVATSEETIAPAELAPTPVVAVGRGVPAAGKETPVKEALTVVDADALARGIVRMALEPELRDRLSRNARRSYEKYFSFENFAENFVKLLMEAISSRKKRRAADKAPSA